MRNPKTILIGLLVLIATIAFSAISLAQEPEFLIDTDHPMAAFLESRAYGKSLGATAEFNKMEGVALDPINNKVYIAMASVEGAMSDDEGDIQVEQNKCGIVYEADLDENFDISTLTPVVIGGPYDEADEANPCAVDNVANPDGLYVDNQGNLWIGEDTGYHSNNALWMWDGESLQRFATVPPGAEITGLRITANDDMFFNVQHPSASSLYPYNRGVIGAIVGYKAGEPFTPISAPTGDDALTVITAAGEYQVLGRVGEDILHDLYANRFGQVNNVNGDLMGICNQPDGNMYLPVNEDGSEGYLYTNFECDPGGVSKLYISQTDEGWEVLEGENLDFSAVNGTWKNCNGSVTPWNTALSSEEYEIPAVTDTELLKKNTAAMTAYLGEQQANPYDYGWILELNPEPSGLFIATQISKHYSMGRFSHEMAVVMPDAKTAYHGDDGGNVMLFKTVADAEGDLSANSLYAAKVTQNGDNFDLEWIELGHAMDDEVLEAIRSVELE